MKASSVIQQLQSVLPNHTDSFTDNFSVTSLVRASTTVTAITSAVHGLITNDFAFIYGATNQISIISLTQIGGIATAITATDHDLTLCSAEVALGRVVTVEISGAAESDYNGTHTLLSVPDRNTFTYKIVATAPATATGTIFLENYGLGYVGWHQVTVIDTTTFTYETTETPNSPAGGTIEARLRPRISGAVSIDQIEQAYTKKQPTKLWAFVVIGDKVANKNREVLSDATMTQGIGESYRQLVIQPFSIFCLLPSTVSIVARQERDAADDLVLPFCKSLLRLRFPSGFAEDSFSGVVFSYDRFSAYSEAYYVHEYAFETTARLTYGDTLDPEHSMAFRDIDLEFETTLNTSAGVVMTASIDLDEDS